MDREEQRNGGPPTDRASRLGRRIGTAVYLVLLTYVVSIGFATFILGIFFHPVRQETAEERAESCDVARAKLALSLHERASHHIAGDSSPTNRFLESWDQRLDAMRNRCNDSRTDQLERMRHRLEITLRRFDRESAPSLARLEAPLNPSPEERPR